MSKSLPGHRQVIASDKVSPLHPVLLIFARENQLGSFKGVMPGSIPDQGDQTLGVPGTLMCKPVENSVVL